LDKDLSIQPRRNPICAYAKLESKSQIRLVHQVAHNLNLGNYHKMVAMEPEITAKILAIRAHIQVIQKLNSLS
jgi:hypothetical protein